jgi:hypothetical protein
MGYLVVFISDIGTGRTSLNVWLKDILMIVNFVIGRSFLVIKDR